MAEGIRMLERYSYGYDQNRFMNHHKEELPSLLPDEGGKDQFNYVSS